MGELARPRINIVEFSMRIQGLFDSIVENLLKRFANDSVGGIAANDLGRELEGFKQSSEFVDGAFSMYPGYESTDAVTSLLRMACQFGFKICDSSGGRGKL
mgnify:CR=1 FL=1